MKKTLAALALAAVAMSCAKKETAKATEAVLSLETATVERRSGTGRIEVDGTVVGRVEATLSSRLAAPVVEVRAVPGTRVREGTVLVRLETHETESALAGARSALEAARAALAMATKNRERFEKLEGRGAAAAIELDRVRQEEAGAAAAFAGAEAGVRRAEADRAQAVLTAPFDSVVLEKMVSEGDLAAPGKPLVRLASLSGRRVEAAPSEEETARLSPGDSVEISIDGKTLSGRVAEIVGAVDPQTRRRTIRADLPADVEPPVGAFARLVLPGAAVDRLVVPQRAIVARGGLELVWAVGPDGRVALRYVRTGAALPDGTVEVRSGLDAGDRVVLDPPPDLEAGTRVRS
jgi:membrane fusion protein, multidrug efflux system